MGSALHAVSGNADSGCASIVSLALLDPLAKPEAGLAGLHIDGKVD